MRYHPFTVFPLKLHTSYISDGSLATILIKRLTEESNGHIMAAAIKIKLIRMLNLNVPDSTDHRVKHKNLSILVVRLYPYLNKCQAKNVKEFQFSETNTDR